MATQRGGGSGHDDHNGYDGLYRVTSFASHIDQTVKRIERAYEVRGMLETVTSYDAESAGNVVNEVKFEYDDFGNPTKDQQAHSGAVGAGTPEVGYAYADGSDNQTRRTAITYPDGRVLDYQYGASDGENDVLSRVEDLKINGESTAAVAYTYAGIARYVKIGYPEPDVELTYLKEASQPVGDAGDQYTGFDRFGRTVDMNWKESGGATEKDRFQWGYDRASNRTWWRNVVAGSGHDDRYGYDGLYQVTSRQQGTLNLNRTAVGGVPAEDESFDYDPTGNWEGYQRDEDGATVLDQSRVNNRDNQITQFDGSSAGVSYDKAGNATLMPPDATGDWSKSYTLTWDGWNRLVKVVDGSTEVAAYAYDGLARRTTRTVGSTVTHCYYSDRWKPLEEREGSSSDAKRQYVWGSRPGHRDELIFRDRDTTGNGTLDERLYALMDYFNGTSIIDENGVVQERYEYSAFGVWTVMAADFSERSASLFEWEFGFQGQFLDGKTGCINYGFRHYSPRIGKWPSKDPITVLGGLNLYAFVSNNTIAQIDRFGLIDAGRHCPCGSNIGEKIVTDDAGRSCCNDEIAIVELRLNFDRMGHSWIHTPNMGAGLYPGDNRFTSLFTGPNALWQYFTACGSHPGTSFTSIGSGTEFDPADSTKYEVCPETLQALEDSISDNLSDDFHLGNMTGRNCAGWTSERLNDAGLSPPNGRSYTDPGLRPGHLRPPKPPKPWYWPGTPDFPYGCP